MKNESSVKEGWKSPTLGEHKEIQIVGREGTPVMVFPSETARMEEWEEHGMFETLQEQVNEGYNQFFCLSGMDEGKNTGEGGRSEAWQMKQYQSYISDEVLSFIGRKNPNRYLIAAGIGEGAYHAAMAAFLNPERIKKVILVSGMYQMEGRTGLPEFVSQLSMQKNGENGEIDTLDIRILTFENDPRREESRLLSDALWKRAADHQFYVWNLHADDAWQLAGQMIREHIY